MAETVPPNYTPQWGTWTRQLMTVVLIIAGLFALTLLSAVVQMLTVAFLLTFVLYVPARSLTRRVHFPWAFSVFVIYMTLLLTTTLGIVLVIPAAVQGVQNLSNSLSEGVAGLEDELVPYLQEGVNTVEVLGVQVDIQFILDPVRQALNAISQIDDAEAGTGTETIPDVSGQGEEDTPTPGAVISANDLRTMINSLLSIAATVTETLTSAIASITGLFTSLLIAVLISFFLLLDVPTLSRTITLWIPESYNREYAILTSRIVRVWNGFFKGQVIIGLMIGIITFIQLQMMGVPSAALLAVLTGTISLIPTIGGFIALLPLGTVALLSGSSVFPQMPNGVFALFVIGVNAVIAQVIWNVVAPKILGDVLDLPLVLIIVGVFIGAAVGGVLGAFLVAPIMGTIRIFLLYIVAKIGLRDPFPGEIAPFELGEPLFKRRPRPLKSSIDAEDDDDSEQSSAPAPLIERG